MGRALRQPQPACAPRAASGPVFVLLACWPASNCQHSAWPALCFAFSSSQPASPWVPPPTAHVPLSPPPCSAAGLPAFMLMAHACVNLTRQCGACFTALDAQRGAALHDYWAAKDEALGPAAMGR